MIHPRLLLGIEEILRAPFEALKDPDWLAALVRETGLCGSEPSPSGAKEQYAGGQTGLIQSPRELAEFLVFLSSYPIQTALEVGTFNGWTAAVMTAYLNRWNPCLHVTSIDPSPEGADDPRSVLSCVLPLSFARRTSADLRGRRFDLCFIDAMHDHRSVSEDYRNVGRFAKICAFHDINLYRRGPDELPDGGVPRFWRELRQSPGETALFREFVHWSPGQPLMGIGVRIYV